MAWAPLLQKKKKIEPGYIYYGKPVKKIKKNLIGLKKNKINKSDLLNEKKRFNKLLKAKKK